MDRLVSMPPWVGGGQCHDVLVDSLCGDPGSMRGGGAENVDKPSLSVKRGCCKKEKSDSEIRYGGKKVFKPERKLKK